MRRLVPIALLALAAAFAGCGTTSVNRSGPTSTAAPATCNGSAALCDRRLDAVVFPGTHNSYAASTEPGWHFANQTYPIARQLDDGITALLVDVHFAVPDAHDPDLVRTDLRAEGSDRNKVAKVVGPRGLRLADAIGGRVGVAPLQGTPRPYLCHGLCELGSEPLGDELAVIRRFLASHPTTVLVAIVEDYVPPAVVERAFDDARLLPYVATLDREAPMPTLGTLIEQGHRLVVFAEDHGGKPPWYMPAFSFIQDTPLGARHPGQLSCARFRGEADSPLLLINHWIDVFPPHPALEAPISGAAAIRRRVERCTRERGVPGAIVAVDFHERTAVVRVARQLNERPDDPVGR
jgi:hypothetical protein